MASGDTIFEDTFTEASDTLLEDHTPDTGDGWTSVYLQDVQKIEVLASTDKAQPDATDTTNGQVLTADATYPSANYQIHFTADLLPTGSDEFLDIFIRYNSQANNGFYMSRFMATSSWDPTIYKGSSASAITALNANPHDHSDIVGYVDGDTFVVEAVGTYIAVYGGRFATGASADEEIARTVVNDSSVTTAGKAALGMGATWYATSGDMEIGEHRVDDFKVLEVGDTVYGFNDPTTTGETDNDFTNPTNAYSSDDSYVTIDWDTGVGSYAQDYGDFGFSITSDDTIRGISVLFETSGDFSSWTEWEIFLSKDNGSTYPVSKVFRTGEESSDYLAMIGRADSLWGTTWSPSDFNDANFRVKILAKNRGSTSVDDSQIDHVAVRVVTDAATGGSTGIRSMRQLIGHGQGTRD